MATGSLTQAGRLESPCVDRTDRICYPVRGAYWITGRNCRIVLRHPGPMSETAGKWSLRQQVSFRLQVRSKIEHEGRTFVRSDSTEEFTGKYEKSGVIGLWLIDRFFTAARRLLMPRINQLESVLEIGCGPGYSSQRIQGWLPEASRFLASDLSIDLISNARRLNPSVGFIQQSVYELAHADRAFDLAVMLEVLEHLDEPERALRELQRVSSKYVLLSTPREPIWRTLNFCRGKYLTDLGNTPGHIQHWSSSGLRKFVSPYFEVVDSAQPIPWTILLLKPRRPDGEG
ncbi:3-demethylubiquinone-9 3-methyltransferase domain protein [Wenzhouxiangella marina]|uniref:3-demethylubiquinone-9 3-methyltransferase domain protein n=1 Tax=Wenzhouxiangella marina TaxID=1579979 RepID=A0A0K0XX41_9GAMM|nr:3-demethylubiquinone-9 3-methyltransferase domain protein [Wenzhouxiangella marina]